MAKYPVKHKAILHFNHQEALSNKLRQANSLSINTLVGLVKKRPKDKASSRFRNKPWLLKQLADEGDRATEILICEISSAASDLFRLLLGVDRAPKQRKIIDAQQVVVKKIPKFISLEQELAQYKLTTEDLADPSVVLPKDFVENLVQDGVGRIIAANYLLQENDCHWGNLGRNQANELCRIDFDQSFAPWTMANASVYRFYNFTTITENDLKCLLNPSHYCCENSLLKQIMMVKGPKVSYDIDLVASQFGQQLLQAEAHGPLADDKWLTLIKASLIPRQVIKNIFHAHVSSASVADSLTSDFYERCQLVAKALLKIPQFKQFLQQDNEYCLETIIEELEEFNSQLSDQSPISVGIDAVHARYAELYRPQKPAHTSRAGLFASWFSFWNSEPTPASPILSESSVTTPSRRVSPGTPDFA